MLIGNQIVILTSLFCIDFDALSISILKYFDHKFRYITCSIHLFAAFLPFLWLCNLCNSDLKAFELITKQASAKVRVLASAHGVWDVL